PPMSPSILENVTKVRFTELSISSMHIRMISMFLRIIRPARPMKKMIAENARTTQGCTSISIRPLVALSHGDRHHGDDRREQQHRREFKGEHVLRKHELRDYPRVSASRFDRLWRIRTLALDGRGVLERIDEDREHPKTHQSCARPHGKRSAADIQ